MSRKVALGELIKPAKVKRCGNDSYPVLSMTMHNGIVMQSDRFKKELASKDTSNYKVVRTGQLVEGFPIDEGVIYIQSLGYSGIMSPAYKVWDVNDKIVLPEYLDFALHSPQSMAYYRAKLRGTTARRRSIPDSELLKLRLELPDLVTQRQIVCTLRGVRSDIGSYEAMTKKLDDLVKSRFIEMFGDGEGFASVPMERLVPGIVSGTNVAGNQRPIKDGEYGVLKISAVTQGWFKADEYKVVDDVSRVKMVHPRKGDLLFSRANTSEMVGATAIVDRDYENLFLPDKLWRLDPAQDVEAVFLKNLLSTNKLRAEMSKVSTGTSGSMQNISMRKFRKLQAFLPPMELQREFAEFVGRVDKSAFEARQAIDKLQLLYDSLAQEYFGD